MNIEIKVIVQAPVKLVWEYWITPEHIIHWNFASPDWCCPRASNDLRVGGIFSYRMEAKDGSFGFDFTGKYTAVQPQKLIEFELEDNRKVRIQFNESEASTEVIESFDAENENDVALQKAGWQAILNNFKSYTENR